jgi:hypothetical protein
MVCVLELEVAAAFKEHDGETSLAQLLGNNSASRAGTNNNGIYFLQGHSLRAPSESEGE